MTYALIGGATGWYWDFFPAPRVWGRIPVWGFGKVVASEIGNVETGEELFGYFPMSTHVLLKPGKIRSDALHDVSEHRPHLLPAYNYYMRTLANPAFDSRSKREIMLPRPLFFASFLVHDLLAERVAADADTICDHERIEQNGHWSRPLIVNTQDQYLPYRWTNVEAKSRFCSRHWRV
jgi:hypothetical protein